MSGRSRPCSVDQHGDVVGHQPHVQGPVDVRGAAVALQVDGVDLVVLGQRRQHRAEGLTGHQPAVQQDQRASGPVRRNPEIDAVDLDVAAGALRVGRAVGSGRVGLLGRRSGFRSKCCRCAAPQTPSARRLIGPRPEPRRRTRRVPAAGKDRATTTACDFELVTQFPDEELDVLTLTVNGTVTGFVTRSDSRRRVIRRRVTARAAPQSSGGRR